ncbi:MAG: O-antigen ligase family protein [Bacteroidales bacterium]
MRVKISNLLLILLLPAFAEVINSRLFLINLPGFPLSLGRLLFVICGLFLLFRKPQNIPQGKILIGLFLIFIGLLLASIIHGDGNAISKSLAFLLLFVASYGNVSLWEEKWGRRSIDVFFLVLFIYWSINSLSQNVVSGSVSYAELYKEGDVVNHHVAGMLVSVSSAYLACRFFYSETGLKLGGYIILFISLITCLFIESRSNFLVGLLVVMYIILRVKSKRIIRIITSLPLLLIMIFSLSKIISGNEVLKRRFTLADIEYQERTTDMRWDYILQGMDSFVSNPLGKGIIDTQVIYKGRTTMVHNQYLTYLMGGGIIAFLGIILLGVGFLKLYGSISLVGSVQLVLVDKVFFALGIACSTFFLTLFTVEMSGQFFFLMCSFLLFIEKEAST